MQAVSSVTRRIPISSNETVPRKGDRELLDQFVETRDPAIFESLVKRHGPMVLAVCRRILADASAAQDAFQATFLILLKKAASLQHGELLGNWLYGVAYRTATRARMDAAKRVRREGSVPQREPGDPLAEITGRELIAAIDEEVVRLPAECRAAIVACYLEGKTRDEAAGEFGWSLATLGRRLSRGRDLLRERLIRRNIGFSAFLILFLANAAAAVPRRLTQSLVRSAAQILSRGKLAAPILATAWMLSGGPLSFRMDPAPPAMVVAIPKAADAIASQHPVEAPINGPESPSQAMMEFTDLPDTSCGMAMAPVPQDPKLGESS